eukprot:8554900-Pyramimonas_sp.AAC.1
MSSRYLRPQPTLLTTRPARPPVDRALTQKVGKADSKPFTPYFFVNTMHGAPQDATASFNRRGALNRGSDSDHNAASIEIALMRLQVRRACHQQPWS